MNFDTIKPAVIAGTWRYRHDRDYADIKQEGYLRAVEILQTTDCDAAAIYMAVKWGAINGAEKWLAQRQQEIPMGEKIWDVPAKIFDANLSALQELKASRPILYTTAAAPLRLLEKGGGSYYRALKRRAEARKKIRGYLSAILT